MKAASTIFILISITHQVEFMVDVVTDSGL